MLALLILGFANGSKRICGGRVVEDVALFQQVYGYDPEGALAHGQKFTFGIMNISAHETGTSGFVGTPGRAKKHVAHSGFQIMDIDVDRGAIETVIQQ
jgi:hypothetical protein